MGAFDQIAHGAIDHAEFAALGIAPEQVIDFSSNLNPFGPPSGVHAALSALDPVPYPDRSCLQLRMRLGRLHGCEPDRILVGNGANELIHLIARALADPPATALVIAPAYGEYEHASRLNQMQIVEVRTQPEDGFHCDIAMLSAAIRRVHPRLTWLCAPNNPTGVGMEPAAVCDLARLCADCDGFLVVDRAYHVFQRSLHDLRDPLDAESPPNLVRLYSLTKSYALAGLRLGYLIARPTIVAGIGCFQPAWSVNSAAQVAGLAALADTAFLPATLPRVWAASDDLVTGLRRLGLEVWRAALPFMLVHCGNGAAVRIRLLRRGCLVRDCASFGLPEWVRVAPRQPAANARLIDAWREIV